MSRVRLVPVLVIALISLAVLFGFWQAYQHYKLFGPLESELRDIPGVSHIALNTASGNSVVVQLGPFHTLENGDLQTTYESIESKVRSTLGTTESIVLEDKSNAFLSNEYVNLEPMIFEGIRDGQYTQMIQSVEKSANSQGVAARITMDAHHFFIQLQYGSHYFYKVLSYQLNGGGASS
ncbi:MAG: hypothetical protein OWQ59_07070 [Alicyclobacillaceae bacterium]|uniref:hypothetical protein n=1 Tax=Alicyclobacillus sp. SP_1 TaxID=2942475 RepID=UPI002157802C|nr:hypothetical protein [Alicyclobacillus sp. SP_1]MCY0888206.1 hypothetical protein [Alicyclobacillaceae bacterium]MCY0896438.1 hypothetical protein [Alicyclobacillaceae bacterium]